MNRLRLAQLALLAGVSSGCATFQETGAAAGTALGAATGAIIGSQTGDAGAGAVIGGALGAVTGSLVGAGMDETDRRNEARIAAATAPVTKPLNVSDIIQMSHSGVGDGVIISSIQSSHSVFQLSAADVVSLHNQGVSDRVIQAMLDTSRTPAVVRQPVVVQPAAPVYVVEPPPRVAVGIGFGPRYRHHCWHHHW